MIARAIAAIVLKEPVVVVLVITIDCDADQSDQRSEIKRRSAVFVSGSRTAGRNAPRHHDREQKHKATQEHVRIHE